MRGNPYCHYYYVVAIAAVVLSFPVLFVQCQVADDDYTNPVVNPTLTQDVSGQLLKLTSTILSAPFTKNLSFCIKNPEVEWDQAFNYSSNLTFLRSCIQKTKGDVLQRLCTPAEAKLYFNNFVGGGSQSVPNKNCNLTSWPWVPGCEPGWACSVKPNDVDLNNSKDIPSRTLDCQACCEGFFCPVGLTCMIPCPLGSYCPLATLNVTTGMCDPYRYRPAGQLNHACGAANIWTDVDRSSEVFCSAGSYCPSSNKKALLQDGFYLRESGLQSQFSRTFSRRKTVTPSEELRILSQTEVEIDDDLHPITHASILSSSEQSSAAVGRKKLEPSGVMRGTHATEEGPDIRNDSSIEVEEKNVKRPMPKKSHLHTDNQIFEYAYDQLQKEKAMQHENLTFSGVISMANNREIRKRPIIEVSFRDLTLTLKGKNKHILRCVTGRIEPGRITAVMGPSGAGKTTFLSALVGKTVGCKMTGSILINGKNESIHSYRKVIGFVPQDDIVHGNLTVEENLWFSARCRLSANLLKEDKVLILERVIESLGLQAVRDSLVGTVEKRGISGGQRKRVNVGLELVMEPSLLILDEPTSGLDSSSSQLLLRALRREALVGVNICMVVHQPSYTLFKMFDDLVLLAKGGLTVYHGPVRRVEEYFAGLGINVPERVNPPDHFIDVLEDIVKPSTSSGISSRKLPVQWMLHKGYQVPPDMQQNCAGLAIPAAQVTLNDQIASDAELVEQSLAREVWQDMRCNVELQRDIIRHNFLRLRDLSNRRTPGVLLQYKSSLGGLSSSGFSHLVSCWRLHRIPD
ncbi:hypothetical protein Vadar_014729 [Vaccinium darrowii]|uniref:Uncharacterized protein n=1 Tax=Vaccinium darrowii TaxID=229202 RepID=A0ACB7XHW1_9ERIC|nr:hypothetical protein Vadar_014729 [Vaccinium darrowii]